MELKNIYRGKEFKFYDEFMGLRQALIDDFLKAHPDFSTVKEIDGLPPHTPGGMRAVLLSYTADQESAKINSSTQFDGNSEGNYPTAYQHIIKKYPECTLACYSILCPHSVITRHTGGENKDGKYVRVHIPLIIPEGDVGFEVACEEVDWSDLFAFYNQKTHSAWNNTDEYRLVMVVDMPRELCDLPQAPPWDPEDIKNTPRFPKGEMPERDRKKLEG